METQQIEFRKVRDFGALLSVTFEFVRQNFKLLFKSSLFIAGPFIFIAGVFLGLYQSALFNFATQPALQDFGMPFMFYMFFAGLSLLMLTLVVYSFILLYKEQGYGNFDVDDIWQKVKGYFWMIFLTGIGYIVIVTIGTIFLIIPGIYLGVALSLIYMVRLEEGKGFFDSLDRCTKIVSRNWWFTFGFILVIGIIQGFISFIFYIPTYIAMFAVMFAGMNNSEPGSASKIIIIITSIIASLNIFIYAVSIIGIAFHYFNLIERREAPALMQQIESIK